MTMKHTGDPDSRIYTHSEHKNGLTIAGVLGAVVGAIILGIIFYSPLGDRDGPLEAMKTQDRINTNDGEAPVMTPDPVPQAQPEPAPAQ